MDLPWRLKFGVFMAPYHAVGENPSLAIRRDVRTLQLLDELGFDEAFIGEHHSAGWEPISSPEVFIAHVAQVTRAIRLGSGVLAVPYHNPYMVAERALLLDQLTEGRFMLGVGPGALPSDTAQFGIGTTSLRPRLDEGLGVILRLLRGEIVSHQSEWFTLREASCQLQPYSLACPSSWQQHRHRRALGSPGSTASACSRVRTSGRSVKASSQRGRQRRSRPSRMDKSWIAATGGL